MTEEAMAKNDVATNDVTVGSGLAVSSGTVTIAITDDAWNAAVGAWIAAAIANSAVAQSTPAFNHLIAALPALRDALQKELG